MRFRIPEIGEVRTRRIFLWFPVQATVFYDDDHRKGRQEMRWLEFANIREHFRYHGWEVTEFIV